MSNQRINIQFPDGSQKAYEQGVLARDVAKSISTSLFKAAVVCRVNGTLVDLTYPLQEDCELTFYTLEDAEGIEAMRHTAAHVLAQALTRLYPQVLLTIGPVIDNGFYYDIDLDESISEVDLNKIEKEMKKIQSENLDIVKENVSYDEAKALFKDNPYKLEIIEQYQGEQLSVYRQGEFLDLCVGPHVPNTKFVKHVKLTKVSGAYWRGDSDNKMLQRIYGVAFQSQAQLDDYFEFLREAEARNHRKLGKQLKLFMFSEEAPGMPFYLSNGQFVRNQMENFLREIQLKNDYDEVRTPLMMNQKLWEESGHWDHYHENMYFTKVDENDYALKPMNCPGHMLIFKNELRSYKDLPLRMAEFGQVHRHEFSGALNGLLRVRTFCQDDAHIFIMKSQIKSEVEDILKLIDYIYSVFGFTYSIELSTRPEDYLGELKLWNEAEQSLANVLDELGLKYTINEGDGAFYGPKIDVHIKDALNRSHQCATVQLDFQMPEKFDLTYINEQNEKERPVVLHRTIFGSLDRFFGILIEHFKGAFPLWMAPVQVNIIGVSDNNTAYVNKVFEALQNNNIRVVIDDRDEKLGKKIRESQMKKIPYTLVLGDHEQENNVVSARKYSHEDNELMDIQAFIAQLQEEVESKALLV